MGSLTGVNLLPVPRDKFVALPSSLGLLWCPAQTLKNPSKMQETQVQSLDWEDPLEKGMATAPVFLPGEFHGLRDLAGYSP